MFQCFATYNLSSLNLAHFSLGYSLIKHFVMPQRKTFSCDFGHLVCGKMKQIFLKGFIIWRLIRKILRVCNTDATCVRLFFKFYPKSAKWQLVWQSEDAMENVTNYTTSIAMFKAKSFQKVFQQEKKKVQFQI